MTGIIGQDGYSLDNAAPLYDETTQARSIEQPVLLERAKQWGDPVLTHARIATAWSAILDHPVTATEAALMMAALKLVRAAVNPTEPDSFEDCKGYVKIAEMIAFDGDSDLEAIRGLTSSR